MRLFLRLTIITAITCAIFCWAALAIGRQSVNTVVAYSAICGDDYSGYQRKTFIADWRPNSGLRLAMQELAVPLLSPSWSADGQQLAYTAESGGASKVYIRDFKTGLEHSLPDHMTIHNFKSIYDAAPSWSPNGHSIAFVSDDSLISVYDILTDQVQNFPLQIIDNGYPNAWSPDGNSLAVSGFYQDKPSGLYILSIASGEIQDLSQGRFDMTKYPAWSPDGRALTFSGLIGYDNAVYRVDLQTNTLSRFSKNTAANVYAVSAWSPDGQMIAATTWNPKAEVHLFNPSGDLIRRITLTQQIPDLGGGESQVAWSLDGEYLLLYVSVNSQYVNYAYELATGEVYPLSPDNRCNYSRAVWRPDPPP